MLVTVTAATQPTTLLRHPVLRENTGRGSIHLLSCAMSGLTAVGAAYFVQPAQGQVITERSAFLNSVSALGQEGFESPFVAGTSVSFSHCVVSANIELFSTARFDLVSEGSLAVGASHAQSSWVSITFPTPLLAFGIDINDFGDAADGVTLIAAIPEVNLEHLLISTPPRLIEGETRFFGFVSETPFSTVTFRMEGFAPLTEGVGFDSVLFSCISVESTASHSTCPTGTAPFSVTPGGIGPFTCLWQIEDPTSPGDWHGLGNDPGPLPGGGTAFAFPINSPAVSIGVRDRVGVFNVRCVVTNACGSVNSNSASLNITNCAADVNCDGIVNSADFFDFLTAFFNNAPAADFNADTTINSQDFFDFIAAFFAGC